MVGRLLAEGYLMSEYCCWGSCWPEGTEEEEEKKISVSIDEWVEVWGETVGRARKMDDLPMWLQYYPKTLFDTINRRQGLFLV